MQTIKLEIEDSKVDVVLNIIQNLKDNIKIAVANKIPKLHISIL